MTPPAAADEGPAAFARPEHRLIVRSARVRLDAADRDLFESLVRGGLDWEHLADEAWRHGLGPLLYHHLKATCPDEVPEDVMGRLREHFHATASRNLYMTREALGLLKLFEANDVPALFYKGPIIAASVYGNLSLREFGDLDVLVRRRDVPKAKELLLSQGYEPGYPLTADQELFHLKTNNEYKFDRPRDGASVDLHWEVAPMYFHFPLGPESLWEHRQSVPLGGSEVPTLSAEDTLLALCVHGVFHLWGRLEWVCGVAEMVRARERLDWARVLERAEEADNRGTLFCGLYLARDLLEAPLPEEVSRKMESHPRARALAQEAAARLFRPEEAEPGVVRKALYHTRAMDLGRSRAAYLARLASVPNRADWSLVALPPALFFLYYAIRPLRLAASLVREAAGRIRPSKEG